MDSTRRTSPRRHLLGQTVLAVLLVSAGAWWLSWLHAVAVGATTPTDVARRAGALALLALPVVLVAIPASLAPRDGDPGRAVWRPALIAAPVTAVVVAVAEQLRGVVDPASSSGLLPAIALGTDLATLLVVLLPLSCTWFLLARARSTRIPRTARLGLVAAVCAVTAMSPGALAVSAGAAAVPESASCLAGGPVDKSFDVTALDVNIPVNRFGDHDPLGKMYALTSALPAIAAEASSQQVSVGLHDDPIQPLVIRANEGDCIEIHYTNTATGGDFGLHIDGVDFDVASSGDSIGTNPSSAVPTGTSRTLRFSIPNDKALEGGHYLHPGPGYRAAVDHGLFGALVVEPQGSTYWDATTPGTPLASGWEAIIKPLGTGVACDKNSLLPTCAFREAALLHHEIGNDNETIQDKKNQALPLQDNTTGSYRPGAFALNYRSEPFRNRLLAFPKEEAHAYSSVTFGEPATPMMRGYLGDPTKIRLMHVGAEKFHVFHLHGGGDRWRFDPVGDLTYNYADTGLRKDPETTLSPSQRLDSQSIGPGEAFNLEIEGGAGGVQQSSGDFLFHCHISKHYVSGMWGIWRVYSTRQPDLVPLADRTVPAAGVESTGLIGKTFNGVKITASNLDAWIRPQLPPQGVPKSNQDATVWDWKVAGSTAKPRYLGAPADPTVFPDSVKQVPGQPNLLAVDVGHIVSGRPAILFDPTNGRPAYPMFRTKIGSRPPFAGNGHTGTPWLGNNTNQAPTKSVDPYATRADGLCPANRKLRTFNVVAIAVPIQRTPTVTDPDGKIFVLAHDKAATYASPAKATPLAIRANQGDCVALTLTNEMPDASAFNKFSKVEMHIHHVQFDVQGSDGVSVGFAYEHSVRPYSVTDSALTQPAPAGATSIVVSDVTKFVGKDANGKATQPWIAVGEGLETIDVHQVLAVDSTTKTLTLDSGLNAAHAVGEFAGSEFVQYRWYPDVVLDNIFWHDHVDGIHGWGHGLVGQFIVEPAGSTYHDPATGAEVDSGTIVDIHTTNPLSPGLVDGSFREMALWTLDDNDSGQFSTLSLKANPLVDRPDKANQFSSWKYGDPITPLPRLYANDPLVIRAIDVSAGLDTLHVVGGRTSTEPRYAYRAASPSDAASGTTIVDAVHLMVSEKFSLILNGDKPDMRLQPGDYLYGEGQEQGTQDGAWGIIRVLPGRVDGLQPLPGVDGPTTDYTLPTSTGGDPPATTDPGSPCPTDAPVRRFALTAIDRSGTFNGARTAYVPTVDVPAIQKKLKNPVPLVMHVVAGECVRVDLTNALTAPVGLAMGKLVRGAGSGGVNVGFDTDQNVAPGATRQYVYYAPTDRVGAATIADLSGASRTKQGLYGTLVVAPASQVPGLPVEFSDPVTGRATSLGAQVIVHVPGAATPDYRDLTVVIADDDAAIGRDFMPYPTNAVAGRSLINYTAAPAGDGPTAFTNPGTVPYLTSFVGDPELVHVMVAPGSENAHVFGLGGLRWKQDPFLNAANTVTAQGMGAWETYTADVVGGAGGTAAAPGDYFYGDLRRPFTAVGIWGIQRTLPTPVPGATCPILLVDGSAC